MTNYIVLLGINILPLKHFFAHFYYFFNIVIKLSFFLMMLISTSVDYCYRHVHHH